MVFSSQGNGCPPFGSYFLTFDSVSDRHTSFTSVEVMPSWMSTIEVEIRDDDIKMDTFRSGGL